MKAAHDFLNQQQAHVRGEVDEEPPHFGEGDLVLLENRRRRQGESSKLQPPFCGPYFVLEAFKNHTYKIKNQGQTSVQNKCQIKEYLAGIEAGRALITQEARRMPNMKGAVKRVPRLNSQSLPVQPEPPMVVLGSEPEPPATCPVEVNPPGGVTSQDKDSTTDSVPAPAPPPFPPEIRSPSRNSRLLSRLPMYHHSGSGRM